MMADDIELSTPPGSPRGRRPRPACPPTANAYAVAAPLPSSSSATARRSPYSSYSPYPPPAYPATLTPTLALFPPTPKSKAALTLTAARETRDIGRGLNRMSVSLSERPRRRSRVHPADKRTNDGDDDDGDEREEHRRRRTPYASPNLAPSHASLATPTTPISPISGFETFEQASLAALPPLPSPATPTFAISPPDSAITDAGASAHTGTSAGATPTPRLSPAPAPPPTLSAPSFDPSKSPSLRSPSLPLSLSLLHSPSTSITALPSDRVHSDDPHDPETSACLELQCPRGCAQYRLLHLLEAERETVSRLRHELAYETSARRAAQTLADQLRSQIAHERGARLAAESKGTRAARSFEWYASLLETERGQWTSEKGQMHAKIEALEARVRELRDRAGLPRDAEVRTSRGLVMTHPSDPDGWVRIGQKEEVPAPIERRFNSAAEADAYDAEMARAGSGAQSALSSPGMPGPSRRRALGPTSSAPATVSSGAAFSPALDATTWSATPMTTSPTDYADPDPALDPRQCLDRGLLDAAADPSDPSPTAAIPPQPEPRAADIPPPAA